MTSINNQGSWLYRTADRFYQIPNKVGQAINIDNPQSGRISKWVKKETKAAFDYDFSHFAKLDIGKVKSLLAEPPKGALLLLLYPATVGPRMWRAYERGKEQHDYREVWDVLRRDLTAITLFVYALPIIVRSLSGMVQKKSHVNLLDKHSDQVLTYSQFKNYYIENEKVLRGILAEGNGQGLKKAVNALTDNGLSKLLPHKPEFANELKGLKEVVNKLVDSYKHNIPGHADSPEIQKLAAQAFSKFSATDDAAKKALTHAYEAGSRQAMNAARNLQGEVKGVLQNYAKVRRLPSDMVSFAIIIGLIGWFPVWFNNVWNKWQFEKKMAAKNAAQQNPPLQPSQGFQNGFSAVNMAPPPPSYPMAAADPTPPYPGYNAAHNPFNRVSVH